MRRVHAFEILDFEACPQFLRDAGTDYLEFVANAADGYAPIVDRLAFAIERSGTRGVLDLCAGGGGPWYKLLPALDKKLGFELDVMLSDLNPNESGFERARAKSNRRISYTLDSVDVMDVPEGLPPFRTIFAGFHHFKPDQAELILRDAVRDRVPIAVFEGTQRHVLPILGLLAAPLIAWLATPFIRPFRWSRLIFTYLIPVIPLIIVFDGLVSCLRTYSPEELQALIERIDDPEYTWEFGIEPIGPLPVGVTYLIGQPSARAA